MNWTKPKIKISNPRIFEFSRERSFQENFIKIQFPSSRFGNSYFWQFLSHFRAKTFHNLRKGLTAAVSWKAIKWILPFDIRLIFGLDQSKSLISRSFQRSRNTLLMINFLGSFYHTRRWDNKSGSKWPLIFSSVKNLKICQNSWISWDSREFNQKRVMNQKWIWWVRTDLKWNL